MSRGRTSAARATRAAALFAILVAALSLGPRNAHAEGGSVASDREALVALYHATDGPNWTDSTNWLSDAPIGTWYGVTTDADGRVDRLGLFGNQLTGEIPRELGNLANLKWLSLDGNELTGEIPGQLGNLTNLTILYLERNQLTGEIPRELGDLANLEWLILGGNELTGEIPGELGNLTNLTVLYLDRNQLTGEIPQELGSLAKLLQLGLWDNQLSGEVPREFRSLSNLTWLRLGGNELTGCIPEGVRSVKDSDLESLGLPFCETAPEPPDSGNAGLLPSPPEGAGALPPLALLVLLLAACTAARRTVRGRREAPAP